MLPDSLVSVDGWTSARIPSLTHHSQIPGDNYHHSLLIGGGEFFWVQHKDVLVNCILLCVFFLTSDYIWTLWVHPIWCGISQWDLAVQLLDRLQRLRALEAILRRPLEGSSCCPLQRPWVRVPSSGRTSRSVPLFFSLFVLAYICLPEQQKSHCGIFLGFLLLVLAPSVLLRLVRFFAAVRFQNQELWCVD